MHSRVLALYSFRVRVIEAEFNQYAPAIVVFVPQSIQTCLDDLLVVHHLWYKYVLIIGLLCNLSALNQLILQLTPLKMLFSL